MEETESQVVEQLFQGLTTSNESRTRIKLQMPEFSFLSIPYDDTHNIPYLQVWQFSFVRFQVYIYHI